VRRASRQAGAALLLLAGLLQAALAPAAGAQQVTDNAYQPVLMAPAYAGDAASGPRVSIDAAHHNFHTSEGRYQPFARLLRRDGYRVAGLSQPFSAASLAESDVLVVANALADANAPNNWRLPTPSAFSAAEIAAVRAWVDNGGSLWLIVDHMPFAGAATDLAAAFGVRFSNGFAGLRGDFGPIVFAAGAGLGSIAVTAGRGDGERIDHVMTFTGSAFRPPADAIAVLTFADGFTSWEPEKAWDFDAATPRVPVGGWSQGSLLKVGKGRVAVFGEAGMFTAQLQGPKRQPMGLNHRAAGQNAQLLLNIAHWLSRAPGMPD
jgi:hypothetical protein